jgi:hypothetical protein
MNSRTTSTAAAFLLTTDTTSQTFSPIIGFVSCCAIRLGRFSASPIFRRWTGARCHVFTTIKGTYNNITNLDAKPEPDPRRRLCHISDEQGNRLGRLLDRAMASADFHAPRVRTPQFASIHRCIHLAPVLDDLGFLESTRSRYRICKHFTCQTFTTFSRICESRWAVGHRMRRTQLQLDKTLTALVLALSSSGVRCYGHRSWLVSSFIFRSTSPALE